MVELGIRRCGYGWKIVDTLPTQHPSKVDVPRNWKDERKKNNVTDKKEFFHGLGTLLSIVTRTSADDRVVDVSTQIRTCVDYSSFITSPQNMNSFTLGLP